MNYTCTIHTDYIDETKREEILERCAKIISNALRENAQKRKETEKNEKKNY